MMYEDPKYNYRNEEGDVIEATLHEYHTHYKAQGFVLVLPEDAEQQLSEVKTTDQDAGTQQEAELTTEDQVVVVNDAEILPAPSNETLVKEEHDRRVRRDRDNQRG